MEKRVYFVLGDLMSCVLSGALAGWWAMQVSVFGMMGSMAAGMLVGMGAGMLVGMLLSPLFGAMEVLVPVMLTGMVSGMIIGMVHPMAPLSPQQAVACGGLGGVLCMAAVYGLNARMTKRRES